MTEAVYIHGKARQVSQAETQQGNRQRAALVKPAPFIDTANWSGGEMLVALIAERYKMLAEFYPEVSDYRTAVEIAQDVLAAGLHRYPEPVRAVNEITAPLFAAIKQGRRMTAPASGYMSWEQKARTPIAGIGNPLVPQLDCSGFTPPGFSAWFAQNPNGTVAQYQALVQSMQAQQAACIEENKYRTLLNQHLEKISIHPLYKFVGNPNSTTATVAAKAVQHRLFASLIASDSKISPALITEWMHNGVMRANVAQGTAPYNPTQTIDALKEKAGVGDFGIVTIGIIVAAIAAGAANAKAWINVIKGEQGIFEGFKNAFANTLSVIGNIDWGPEAPDWVGLIPNPNTPGGGGGNGGGGNPGGGGGAGFELDIKTAGMGLLGLFLLSSPKR